MGQVVTLRKSDAPATEMQKVAKGRPKNRAVRTREHLTPGEVDKLIAAARKGRNGHRDATMILVTYLHGLRVSELIDIRWPQIDLNAATSHVNRLKNGLDSTQSIRGDELRALRKLKGDDPGAYVFLSERGGKMSRDNVAKLITRSAEAAGLGHLKVHPHSLRHATGYALGNKGVDTNRLREFLGHRQIANTVKYVQLNPERFRDIWEK